MQSSQPAADLLDQAEQAMRSGDRVKAVHLAREALDRIRAASDEIEVDDRVQQLVRASQALNDIGEDGCALVACQNILQLQPGHAHAAYNAARALKHLGQHAQAEALLDGSLTYHPNDLGLLRLKADLLTTRGAFDEAIVLLRQIVHSAQQDKVAWFNLSNALLQIHLYTEALAAAESAIALAAPPQVADAWVNKGRALRGLGDDMSALAAFQQALRVNRVQVQAHYGLSQLYQTHGQRFLAWRERQYVRLLQIFQSVQRIRAAQRRDEQLRVLDANHATLGNPLPPLRS